MKRSGIQDVSAKDPGLHPGYNGVGIHQIFHLGPKLQLGTAIARSSAASPLSVRYARTHARLPRGGERLVDRLRPDRAGPTERRSGRGGKTWDSGEPQRAKPSFGQCVPRQSLGTRERAHLTGRAANLLACKGRGNLEPVRKTVAPTSSLACLQAGSLRYPSFRMGSEDRSSLF
jgi:hypothetical protein